MTDIAFEDFEAVRDHMAKRFRVYGTVLVPHGGFRVRLGLATPQGTNPDDLLVKLVFQPDFENTPPTQSVEYTEDWGDDEPPTYSSVTFRVEGIEGLEPPEHLTVKDVY